MSNFIGRLCDFLAYAAAGILFALAGLTFCDVVGRRFFDSPVMGTIEIVELGMASAAFFAMPRAFLTNSHVSAQLIEKWSVGVFGVFVTILRGSLMVGMVGLMAYATTVRAIDLMTGTRVTIELEMPFYPFQWIIATGMWCSALAALLWLLRTLFMKQPQSWPGYKDTDGN
jgi:TRAP-type C4-dicarboxylate transport system permease small subunit